MLKRFSILIIVLISIGGCSRDTPELVLENYLYRLSNTLDLDQPQPYIPDVRMQFPLKRDRRLKTTEIREGLLDVLKLKRCHLLPLIAERNSSLGKVAKPSTKLLYELNFYHLLTQCRESLRYDSAIDTELLQKVNAIYRVKRDNLPAELWNGIFTAPEIEANFSRSQTALPLVDNSSSQQSIEALRTLVNLTANSLDTLGIIKPNEDRLNQAFKILHSNRSGPAIISSLEVLTYHLTQATRLLEKRNSPKNPLCRNQSPNQTARILENVFYKFYIGEVLPYLAQTDRYASQWLDLNQQLLQNYTVLSVSIPQSMETYSTTILSKTAPHGIWLSYQRARDKHTEAWQKTLKNCGMMPTQKD
ncbi:DUF3080 family protein [Neptuniibacter sp. SY11_33]|uniref:DUF3080 family protein n=1 Tax=Neptuniibacter sp. SY11_33 TaxID=3398215 RepID=UPI0039F5053A